MSALWSIGKSKRNIDLTEYKASPGPCAYNPEKKSKQSVPAWTIYGTKSRAIYRKNDVPGPGAYKLLNKVFIHYYY